MSPSPARSHSVLGATIICLLLTSACSDRPEVQRPRPHPIDAREHGIDLLSRLPEGPGGVIRLDLARWRRLRRARPGLALGLARACSTLSWMIGPLGPHIAARASSLVIGLYPQSRPGAASDAISPTPLLVARLDRPRQGPAAPHGSGRRVQAWAREALERASTSTGDPGVLRDEEYRDVPLLSRGSWSIAFPGSRIILWGPRTLVRRSLDLSAALPDHASALEERTLVALFGLVMGPDRGGSPVLAAVVDLPQAWRRHLGRALEALASDAHAGITSEEGTAGAGGGRAPGPRSHPEGTHDRDGAPRGPGAPATARQRSSAKGSKIPRPRRLALRMSAGSWVTVRAIADLASRDQAARFIKTIQRVIPGWVRRRGRGLGERRRLGVQRRWVALLKPLAVHQEGSRVYLQWVMLSKGLRRLLDPLTRPRAGR